MTNRNSEFDANARNIIADQKTLGDAADKFKEINEQLKKYGKEYDNINSLATHLNNTLKETVDFQSKLGRQYIKQADFENEVLKLKREQSQIQERINVKIASLGKSYAGIKTNVDIAVKKQQEQVSLSKKIVELGHVQNKTAQQNADLQKAINKHASNRFNLEQLMQDDNVRMLSTMHAALEVARSSGDELQSQWSLQERYNRRIELMNTLLGKGKELLQNISKIPLLGGLFDIVGGGSIIGFLNNVIAWAFKLDKSITDTANSLASSKEASQGLYKSFQDNVFASNKLVDTLDASYLSVINQGKAMNELNGALGTAVYFTDQQLQSQILMTQQMGMSADEAEAIQKFSVLNKTTADQTLKTIVKQNDGVLSYRKVLSQVSKISGQLLAHYKNSPELIAQAVVEANRLGMTLEQAKKSSEFIHLNKGHRPNRSQKRHIFHFAEKWFSKSKNRVLLKLKFLESENWK